MGNPKKQQTITKLFRKQGVQIPEDCEELKEEICQLEQKLKDKQIELFRVQRCSYKRKLFLPRKKNVPFIRPEKIITKNSIDNIERNLELISMLTGMMVKSYVENDHCIIRYIMQHPSQNMVEHGLKINMKNGNNVVSVFSMPLGFNLKAVLEEFDNVMKPECLGSIRKALVAYYDRLHQFEALKMLLSIEAQMFKVLDGTHMEITFIVQSSLEEDEQIRIVLMLDYRVYDIRPKQYSLKERGLPEEVLEALTEQCVVFKRKPLDLAFKECFLDGAGIFNFVHQVGRKEADRTPRRRHRQKRRRPYRYDPNNDDTFVPEECSQSSEDEDEDERRMRKVYGR